MIKKIEITIKVAEKIAPIIGCRDVVDNLQKEIVRVKAGVVNLDFSEIRFISRSVAHAFLVLKENLESQFFRKRKVNFVNASDSVKEMLRIVAANRAMPRQERAIEFKAEKLDINSLIKKIANC